MQLNTKSNEKITLHSVFTYGTVFSTLANLLTALHIDYYFVH